MYNSDDISKRITSITEAISAIQGELTDIKGKVTAESKDLTLPIELFGWRKDPFSHVFMGAKDTKPLHIFTSESVSEKAVSFKQSLSLMVTLFETSSTVNIDERFNFSGCNGVKELLSASDATFNNPNYPISCSDAAFVLLYKLGKAIPAELSNISDTDAASVNELSDQNYNLGVVCSGIIHSWFSTLVSLDGFDISQGTSTRYNWGEDGQKGIPTNKLISAGVKAIKGFSDKVDRIIADGTLKSCSAASGFAELAAISFFTGSIDRALGSTDLSKVKAILSIN